MVPLHPQPVCVTRTNHPWPPTCPHPKFAIFTITLIFTNITIFTPPPSPSSLHHH